MPRRIDRRDASAKLRTQMTEMSVEAMQRFKAFKTADKGATVRFALADCELNVELTPPRRFSRSTACMIV